MLYYTKNVFLFSYMWWAFYSFLVEVGQCRSKLNMKSQQERHPAKPIMEGWPTVSTIKAKRSTLAPDSTTKDRK